MARQSPALHCSVAVLARDDLLSKSDGMLLLYDEDAGEGSPRFLKEKALKRQLEAGYRFISITSEDIQSIAQKGRANESIRMIL